MPEPAGWEYFDVAADVGVRAWGPTRAAAFAGAALGALALTVGPETVRAVESREVRAQADGPETLLVNWVNECLYVHEVEGFAVADVEVTAVGDTLVHGVLHGEPLDPARHRLGTIVKAATLHRVAVEERSGIHRVELVLDV